ncbi:hypothetical protein BHE74_00038308 [Ensete ventricosum]|nr:hypothetical protein BHE74_00038308 [Ensete ventricosum]
MDRPRAVAADTRERSCSPRRSPARRSPRLVAAPHPRAIFPRARRRNVSPGGEKDRGNVAPFHDFWYTLCVPLGTVPYCTGTDRMSALEEESSFAN